MSHQVIIIGQKPPALRVAEGTEVSTATGKLEWAPSHDLTPAQERRRVEHAQRKLDEALDILTATGGEE